MSPAGLAAQVAEEGTKGGESRERPSWAQLLRAISFPLVPLLNPGLNF